MIEHTGRSVKIRRSPEATSGPLSAEVVSSLIDRALAGVLEKAIRPLETQNTALQARVDILERKLAGAAGALELCQASDDSTKNRLDDLMFHLHSSLADDESVVAPEHVTQATTRLQALYARLRERNRSRVNEGDDIIANVSDDFDFSPF
jgi:hypothetical protein